VDYYLYRTSSREQRFPPKQVIHFRYPDPRDPYTGGLSPLRAAIEQVAQLSDYAAFTKAKFENLGLSDADSAPLVAGGVLVMVSNERLGSFPWRPGRAGTIPSLNSPPNVRHDELKRP
jgi:hypothetical protein